MSLERGRNTVETDSGRNTHPESGENHRPALVGIEHLRKERLAIHRPLLLPEGEKYDIVFGHHNIGEVLRGSDEGTVRAVNDHYSQRGAHIPKPAEEERRTDPQTGHPRTRMGLLIDGSSGASQEATEQISYVRALSGLPIEIFEPDDLRKKKTLGVPYIRTPRSDRKLHDLGAEVNGMHPTITHDLKNKADAHQLLREFGSPEFRTPQFEITSVDEVAKQAEGFLNRTAKEYAAKDVSSDMPLGVVLRGAESEGGYGNVIVTLQGEKAQVVKDGDSDHALDGLSVPDALKEAQDHLASTMNQDVERRVVMTPFKDVADSPGMTIAIVNGDVHSLGWNGQVRKPGSVSCIGTSGYEPKDDYTRSLQRQYQDAFAQQYGDFVKWYAQKSGVDIRKVTAMVNVDMLLLSEAGFRAEQQLTGQRTPLSVVEFNMRYTEFSDAAMGGTLFYPEDQTVSGLQNIIRAGVHTNAKYDLPRNTDPRHVREELFIRYQDRSDSGLVVARMTPTPSENPNDDSRIHPKMGIVIYGDRAAGETALEDAVRKASVR